jgi:nucleotide-binding universal stress UspA family protein
MYKNVLLAVDLGEDASWERALPEALHLTRSSGGVLHVVTVVPDYGMTIVGSFFPRNFEQQAIDEAQKRLHAFTENHVPKDVPVQHIIRHGPPADEILAASHEVATDVIVIGSHRPGVEHSVLGSVASKVVSKAGCSVLVVRA